MATLPKTIEVLEGSCVTIPCSFDVESRFENDLDDTCRAIWKNKNENFYASREPKLTTTKEMTGDLRRKDCTTTFNNMHLDYSNEYYLRLECENRLKWNFIHNVLHILVEADPPSPTLTPSTLWEQEGTSVRLTCSAPAPCWSHPPTLTWTPRLGDTQETLQENQDKTKVMTSVLTFTASHLHHGRTISCTAAYNKQDGSSSSSLSRDLTAAISYSPKNTTVSVSPSGPVPEYSSVTLTCTSAANPPVRTYTWYRADGGQETVIGTGQTFKIKASELTAPFFCMAENDVGAGRSDIGQIDVQYSPKNTTVSVSPSGPVPEYSSVTLTCTSAANSAVRTYTWYRADGGQETVIGTGQTFKIKASELTAPFFCMAENDVGAGRSDIGQIDVQYSPKNTTVSVSPSGPVPEYSSVTLTCTSAANSAVRTYTWYRADGGQETVIGTGQTFKIKASELTAPFFCMAENYVGAGRSDISQIDVQFPPQILHLSDCTKTTNHVNCSCETVGNPSPILHWFLDGLPVNHSDKFAISTELLNDTGLRSVITVNQPQWRDLSTLVCHSSNSLGAATQRFCVTSLEQQTSAGSRVQVPLPVFIITVVALGVLVCALLFVIRVQRTHHKLPKSQCTGDTSTFAMDQLLTRTEGNETSNTTEEDIYTNTNDMRQADISQPATTSDPNSSGANNAEEASKSSEKKNEDGSDVIYSTVTWKSKSKKKKREDSVDMVPPGSSYLEEERCTLGDMGRNFASHALEMGIYDEVEPRNVRKEVECEYAQVKFKKKSVMSK
ncbi:B-cell receptor CD22-like isoform X2 [Trachinotus anak]